MEHRYSILRNHLDELGYEQPLIIEAVPLVERLLADLVKTTESLFHYKNVAQSAIEERDQLQLGAEPYKCDNAKLVKECNDLHLAFLQYREQTDQVLKESKHKINILEKENAELNRHLNDFQKSGDISSRTNLRRKTVPSKTSITRHCATSVDAAKIVKSDKSKHKCDCAMLEYEEQISFLKHETKKLKLDLTKMSETCECLKTKLNSRDKEIQRLTNMLEGGRSINTLNKDCCYKDMCTKLRKLTEDNTRISGERKELDKQLSEAISKQHEAMKRALQLADRNKELERELRDIDQMALAVEEECNSTAKQSYFKVSRAQEQIQNYLIKIQSQEKEIGELRNTKQLIEQELATSKEEKENIHKILENTLDDKKRMTDRINQFTRIEHDLNLEIDRLMQTCTLQKRKISDLEYQLTEKTGNNVERDMNYRSKISSGSGSPKSVKLPRGKGRSTDTHKDEEQIFDRLKGERDYYRQECERLCNEMNNLSKPAADSSSIKRRLSEKEDEVARLEKEVQGLTREKHTLLNRLESAQEMNKWGEESDSQTLKSVISRVEKERDMARGDVKRLEEERDSLRKRLKTTAETHVTERDRLQKLMTDSEDKLRKLEGERREMMTVQGSRRAAINNLEEQIETLTTQLRNTQSELEHIHTLYGQMKTLQEQTDRALADTQGQLTQVELEYAHAQDRVRELEKDRSELDKELSVLKNAVCNLKGNLTKIDCQRDCLLIDVDNKTERIAVMEQELRTKDNKLVILDTTIAELRQQLSLYTDDVASKEYQLKTRNNELTSLKRELDEANNSKSKAVAENRRLQNELGAVSLEYRNTNGELERALREIEDLKTQLQQYVFEVKRTEDLISKKESEREHMLDQFRSLSQEASALETNNHSLETKTMEVTAQLSSAIDQIHDMETKVTSLTTMNTDYEKHISQLTCQIACLETKIKQFSTAQSKTENELAAMKELCCKLDGQKDILQNEIKEKDEYKVHTDYQYESSLDEDEYCKIVVNINLEREKERLKVDINKLRNTLSQEKTNLGSIEDLLAESRQETIEEQLINQELQTEIQRLKSMVEELQAKLTATSQQLDVFQEKALDYSQQLKQLRREIANERFRAHSGDLSSRYPSL